MDQNSTVVGLDVHKNHITVAVLPPNSARPREVRTIEHDSQAIAGLVKQTARHQRTTFVYEAGPCGYGVHRQVTALGGHAVVIAPALTPVRPGDRVKTNRRDAEKLARLYRAGELTEIRVPTRLEEAARDLVRAREDALTDRLRARHRLNKFLLRQGRVYRDTKAWTIAHRQWLRLQRFDLPLLQHTFDAYLRAVEEAEDRLASLEQQILDLADMAAYRTAVQYLRCLQGHRHAERADCAGRDAGLPTVPRCPGVHELHGTGMFRSQQRGQNPPWPHHENRQCPPTSSPGGSGVVLPSAKYHGTDDQRTTSRLPVASPPDRTASPGPSSSQILAPDQPQ